MLAIVNPNGLPSSLFRISWPVYDGYSILPMPNYIEWLVTTTGKKLSEEETTVFIGMCGSQEAMDSMYVICPCSNTIQKVYNPLTETPKVFFDFGNIMKYYYKVIKDNDNKFRHNEEIFNSQQQHGYMKKIFDDILKWVCKYGLPYYSPQGSQTATASPIDTVRKRDTEIESFLYNRFKRFGMLLSNFRALADEAYKANKLLSLSLEKASKYTANDFLGLIDQENFSIFKDQQQTPLVKKAIHQALKQLLENRINGHTKQVSFSLDNLASPDSPKMQFQIKLEVPDLLTAMWYQFYGTITNTKNLVPCKECGQYFIATRNNQLYCPPLAGTTISPCRSRHNTREHRENNPKKSTASD